MYLYQALQMKLLFQNVGVLHRLEVFFFTIKRERVPEPSGEVCHLSQRPDLQPITSDLSFWAVVPLLTIK